MDRLEKFQIIFNNPTATYYAAETVYGYGWVVVKEPIYVQSVCLEAIGEAKVEWMTSSDIQASDEEVFNYTTVLPIKGEKEIDDEGLLNPGSHYFPFEFVLPKKLPSSFKGKHGRLRYFVRMTIYTPGGPHHERTSKFAVIGALDLNTEPDASAENPCSRVDFRQAGGSRSPTRPHLCYSLIDIGRMSRTSHPAGGERHVRGRGVVVLRCGDGDGLHQAGQEGLHAEGGHPHLGRGQESVHAPHRLHPGLPHTARDVLLVPGPVLRVDGAGDGAQRLHRASRQADLAARAPLHPHRAALAPAWLQDHRRPVQHRAVHQTMRAGAEGQGAGGHRDRNGAPGQPAPLGHLPPPAVPLRLLRLPLPLLLGGRGHGPRLPERPQPAAAHAALRAALGGGRRDTLTAAQFRRRGLL